MDDGGDGERGTRGYRTDEQDGSSIGRRGCLKLVGLATVSATTLVAESTVVRAASDGYGIGSHGDGPYGDPSGFSVSTQEATDVDATSATLAGELSGLDGADSADCYFEWRRAGTSTWTATVKQPLSSTGSYAVSLSGLADGVEYEYRAVGTASDGDTATGGVVTFATTGDSPLVTTATPSDVTASDATLNGSLDDLGGAESADCGFEWRSVGASSWNTTSTQALSATESFGTDISGLSSGTDYEYRAVTVASDGVTATGETVTFATDSGSTAPAVDSYSVTEAGSPNPHCEITTEWDVSDADGDLDTVVISVSDRSGVVVVSTTTDASGERASGTDTFGIKHVRGQTFDVTIAVTDARGNRTSQTRTVTE